MDPPAGGGMLRPTSCNPCLPKVSVGRCPPTQMFLKVTKIVRTPNPAIRSRSFSFARTTGPPSISDPAPNGSTTSQ